MTNLEFYKDEMCKRITETNSYLSLHCIVCKIKNKLNVNDDCCDEKCDMLECIKWLCEEYKEPTKLKQWEYDFLNIIQYKEEEFRHLDFCIVLKGKKGHFKGVTDTSMTLEEILSNCIIVADDYDFGGNEE